MGGRAGLHGRRGGDVADKRRCGRGAARKRIEGTKAIQSRGGRTRTAAAPPKAPPQGGSNANCRRDSAGWWRAKSRRMNGRGWRRQSASATARGGWAALRLGAKTSRRAPWPMAAGAPVSARRPRRVGRDGGTRRRRKGRGPSGPAAEFWGVPGPDWTTFRWGSAHRKDY